jgi:RecA/RadA recombinase
MKTMKTVLRGRGPKKKEEVAEESVKNVRDKLAVALAKSVNEQFKSEFRAAWFLDGGDDERAGTEVSEWISTGDDMLDLRISNRPHGGIPVGKLTELNGLEGSGKSLILGHLIVETQKKSKPAVIKKNQFLVNTKC